MLRQLNTVASTISVLLFLMVTFRNNAAFARWQSGADKFNSFCDRCRNMARLTAGACPTGCRGSCLPHSRTDSHAAPLAPTPPSAGNLPIYLNWSETEGYGVPQHHIRWLQATVEVRATMEEGPPAPLPRTQSCALRHGSGIQAPRHPSMPLPADGAPDAARGVKPRRSGALDHGQAGAG